MNTYNKPHYFALLPTISQIIGIVVVGIGCVVLFGWIFDIETLKSIFPNLATMKVNTALLFLLSGIGLWVLQQGRQQPYVINICIGLIIGVGLATLLEYIMGWSLHIDELFIEDDGNSITPGRMSSGTAFSFVISGSALWLCHHRKLKEAQLLAIIGCFFALLGIIGYAYEISSLYATKIYASMALHTAFTFLILNIGILMIDATQGWMAFVAENSISGVLLRRLLPAAIGVPFFVGWVRLIGEQKEIYETAFGTALLTLVTMIIFTGVVWWNAYYIRQIDAERIQATHDFHQSQVRFARTIESAMDAIITVDKDQHIVLFNEAAQIMFQYQPETIIGQSLEQIIPVRFRDIHHTHIKSFGETGVTNRRMGALGGISGLRADGEEFPIEASISQIEQDGEKFFTVILRDITERVRFEAELREQEERFRNTFDHAPVGIAHLDLDGKFLLINQTFCDIVGYSINEIRNLDFQAITYDEDLEIDHVQRLLNGEVQINSAEKRYIHKNNDLVWVRITKSLVRDSNKPQYFITIIEDISAQKQLENDLRRLNEELENRVKERTAHLMAVNQELEAFSYSVSHDLRAPLRSIDGFSLALLEDFSDELDEDGQDYLNRVRAASQRMGELIDDMIKLSRITRASMQVENVNLSPLVDEIITKLKDANPERNITFIIQDEVRVKGDERLLKVLLENLLGNAVKYTSKKTEACIEFGETLENNQPTYFVKDNGAGFNMAYADKLFGAFQRLHSIEDFDGSGIGLATCKRILHRHGGNIWAEARIDEGATFYFRL